MQTVIAPDDLVPAFDYVSTGDVPKLNDSGQPVLDKNGDPVTERADVQFRNGDPVVEGQEIQVDDDIAVSLIAQGWDSARSRAARKAAAARKTDDDTAPVSVSEPADDSAVKE